MGPGRRANYDTGLRSRGHRGSRSVLPPSIEIQSELGTGAFSRVMLGRLSAAHGEWPAGTEVAVKRLKPEYAEDPAALEALEREACAARAVDHESFAPFNVALAELEHGATAPVKSGRQEGQLVRASPVPPMMTGAFALSSPPLSLSPQAEERGRM